MIGGDPRVDAVRVLNDVLGSMFIIAMLCTNFRWLRRVGLVFLIIAGVDGVAKYVENFTTITVFEACYQVPWIIAGVFAVVWWNDPPRIHAAEYIDKHSR